MGLYFHNNSCEVLPWSNTRGARAMSLPPLHRLGLGKPTGDSGGLGKAAIPTDLVEAVVQQLASAGQSLEVCKAVYGLLLSEKRPMGDRDDFSEVTYEVLCRKLGWVWSKAEALDDFMWSKWFKRVCFHAHTHPSFQVSQNTLEHMAFLFSWAIRDGGELLAWHRDLRDDREIVLAAVGQDGSALQGASDKLKNDSDVVLKAVSQNGKALLFASNELRDNKEVVLAAVRQTHWVLQFASEQLRDDREVVLVVVAQHGYALSKASDNLKNDREIVLAAVTNDGDALKYASDKLRDDKEVVLAAVQQHGDALRFASEKLRNDKTVVLQAVTENGRALEHASESMKSEQDVVLSAVRNNSEV